MIEKKILKNFFISGSCKDRDKKVSDLCHEVYNGPHEVRDVVIKSVKDVFVISCGVVNPWAGILAEAGISAYDSGLDAEKVMETGSKVYKEADKKFNQTGKMKKALGDTIGRVNFDFWSRIPNIDVNPKLARYGTEIGKETASSILTIKNVVSLLDAIKADKEFYKKKSKEITSTLIDVFKSYTSDEDINNESQKVKYNSFGSMDLSTLLTIKKLTRGEIKTDINCKKSAIRKYVKKHKLNKVFSEKDIFFAEKIIDSEKNIKELVCDKKGNYSGDNLIHVVSAMHLIDRVGKKSSTSSFLGKIASEKEKIIGYIQGESD